MAKRLRTTSISRGKPKGTRSASRDSSGMACATHSTAVERKHAMLKEVILAGAARTPIGTFQGAFAEVPAAVLGSTAIKAAIARSGVPADGIDEVIFGNVLSAGLGQNIARQCTIGAGLNPSVGATTVNKVCGSGLKAVMLAAQAIQCGDASVIIAGGAENMSRAPYLL